MRNQELGLIDKVHLLHKTSLSRLGEVPPFSNAQKVKANEETKENVSNKKISPETDFNEIKISDLSDKEFKMVTKMLTKVRRAMYTQSISMKRQKLLKSTKQKSQS